MPYSNMHSLSTPIPKAKPLNFSWSMFPFFYQAPPVVLAVALGDLRISWVIKMLLAYMVVSTILLLPLHFLWGQYLGFFVGT